MHPFTKTTRAETWLAGVEALAGSSDGSLHNIVLEITEPSSTSPRAEAIEAVVDKFLTDAGAWPLHTIAETIFPAWEYHHHGLRGVFEIYPNEEYPLIKEQHWGTYAYRLVRRQQPNGETFNPLEQCLEKIKRQLATGAHKRAIYELGVIDLGVDLPLYDPATDRNRPINLPCLSHLSFKISRDRVLYLTALYRSHYYIERALGNLLGLARLQAFVAKETNLSVGPIVCVSTLAHLDHERWTLTQVRSLIDAVREAGA